MKNQNKDCMFVVDTRQSLFFPLQVSNTNLTQYKEVAFSKENICKGNFTGVVADATSIFYCLKMRQSPNNKISANNSNAHFTSANETGKFQANLQANFHYTANQPTLAYNSQNEKLLPLIKQFFQGQDANDVQSNLDELYQIFMRSDEFSEANQIHRSNLLFMVTQITSFFHNLEKEVRNGIN